MPMARAMRLCAGLVDRAAGSLGVRRGLARRDGSLPVDHAGGRAARRSTRRSSTCPVRAAGWAARGRSPSRSAPGSPTSSSCRARSASRARSSSRSWRRRGPSRTACWSSRSESVLAFLHPLPIGALWGVGEKTEEALTRIGLRTIGDIAATPVSTLIHTVGKAAGAHLHALASGRDPRRVIPNEPDRSIGAEETFARDIADVAGILRELLRLSERCAERLRAERPGRPHRRIKVRFADFRTISRSRTLSEPTDVARIDLRHGASAVRRARHRWHAACAWSGCGSRASPRPRTMPEQLSLTGDAEEWRAAEQAVDR